MKQALLIGFVFIYALTTNAQVVPGVIGHWPLNGTANDTSGNGHNGHLVNVVPGPGIDAPWGGGSYYFNGVNSAINVPYSPDFNVSQFTICAIVKPEGFYSGTCQGNTIFNRGKTGTGTGNYYLYMGDWPYDHNCSSFDSTKDAFALCVQGHDTYTSGSTDYTPHVTRDTWYKVVAVYNDTDYKVYVNDVLMSTAALASPGAPSAGTDSISIGLNTFEAGAGYPYPFKGYIQDVILYNRVLTDSEIVHYHDTCGAITTQPAIVFFNDGGTCNFTVASSIVGATYQWQYNGGSGYTNLTNTAPYSGVYTPTLTVTGMTVDLIEHNYRCIVTNTWGCNDTSHGALIYYEGINNIALNANTVSIVPNPTKGTFTVDLSQAPNHSLAHIQLINTMGQVVQEMETEDSKTSFDVSAYANGMYFVKVTCAQTVVCKRIIKL